MAGKSSSSVNCRGKGFMETMLQLCFLVLCLFAFEGYCTEPFVSSIYNQYTVTIKFDPISGNYTTVASSSTDVISVVGSVGDTIVLNSISYNSTYNSSAIAYLTGIKYVQTTQIKCFVPLMGGAVMILDSQNADQPEEVFRKILQDAIKNDPGISVYNNSGGNFNRLLSRSEYSEKFNWLFEENTRYQIIRPEDAEHLENLENRRKEAERIRNGAKAKIKNTKIQSTGMHQQGLLIEKIRQRQKERVERIRQTKTFEKQNDIHSETSIVLAYNKYSRIWVEVTEQNFRALKASGYQIMSFNGLEYEAKKQRGREARYGKGYETDANGVEGFYFYPNNSKKKKTILSDYSNTYNIDNPQLSSNVRSLCTGIGNLVSDVYSCTVGGVLANSEQITGLQNQLDAVTSNVANGFLTVAAGFTNLQQQVSTVQSQTDVLASQLAEVNFQFAAMSSGVAATNYAVYQTNLNVALLQNGNDQTNNAVNDLAGQLAYTAQGLVNSQIQQAIATQDNMQFLYQRQQAALGTLGESIYANMAVNNNVIAKSLKLLDLNNNLNLQSLANSVNAALVVNYQNERIAIATSQYTYQTQNILVNTVQELYSLIIPRGEFSAQIFIEIQSIIDLPPNADGGFFTPLIIPGTGFAPKASQKEVGSDGLVFGARYLDTSGTCIIGAMTNAINVTVNNILMNTAILPLMFPLAKHSSFVSTIANMPGGIIPNSFQFDPTAQYWLVGVTVENNGTLITPYVAAATSTSGLVFIPDIIANRYCNGINCTGIYTPVMNGVAYKSQSGQQFPAPAPSSSPRNVIREGEIITLLATVGTLLSYIDITPSGFMHFTPNVPNTPIQTFLNIRINVTSPLTFWDNYLQNAPIKQNQPVSLAAMSLNQTIPPANSIYSNIFQNLTSFRTPFVGTRYDSSYHLVGNVTFSYFMLSKAPPVYTGYGTEVLMNLNQANSTLINSLGTGNVFDQLSKRDDSKREAIDSSFHMTDPKEIQKIVEKFFSDKKENDAEVDYAMKHGKRPDHHQTQQEYLKTAFNKKGDNNNNNKKTPEPEAIVPEYDPNLTFRDAEYLYYPYNGTFPDEFETEEQQDEGEYFQYPTGPPNEKYKRGSKSRRTTGCYTGITYGTGIASSYQSIPSGLLTAAYNCAFNPSCMYVSAQSSNTIRIGYFTNVAGSSSFTDFILGPGGPYNLKTYSMGSLLVPPSLKVTTTILVPNVNDGIFGLTTTCSGWTNECTGYAYRDHDCSAVAPNPGNIGSDCHNALGSYSSFFSSTTTTATLAMTSNAANDLTVQCHATGVANFPCNNCNVVQWVEACLYGPVYVTTNGFYNQGDNSGFPSNAASSSWNNPAQGSGSSPYGNPVQLPVRPLFNINQLQHSYDLRNQYLAQTNSDTYQNYGVQKPCTFGSQYNPFSQAVSDSSGSGANLGQVFPYNTLMIVTDLVCNQCTTGYGDVNGNPIPATSGGASYSSCPPRTDSAAAVRAGGTSGPYNYDLPNIYYYYPLWYTPSQITVTRETNPAYGPTSGWYLCVPYQPGTYASVVGGATSLSLNYALPYFFTPGDITTNQGFAPHDINIGTLMASCPYLTMVQCASFSGVIGLCSVALNVTTSTVTPGGLQMAYSCQFTNTVPTTCSSQTTIDTCIAITSNNGAGNPVPNCAWNTATSSCVLFNQNVLPSLMYNQQTSTIPQYNVNCALRMIDSVQSCTYDSRCYWIQALDNSVPTKCVPLLNYQAFASLAVGILNVHYTSAQAITASNTYGIQYTTCDATNFYCGMLNSVNAVALNYLSSTAVGVPVTPPCSSISNPPNYNLCGNKLYKYNNLTSKASSVCDLSSTNACELSCEQFNSNVQLCLTVPYCLVKRSDFTCFNSNPAVLPTICGANYATTPTTPGSGCVGTNNVCTLLSGLIELDGSNVTNVPPPTTGNYSIAGLTASECVSIAGFQTGDMTLIANSTRLAGVVLPPSMARTCQNYDPGTGFICYPVLLSPFNQQQVVSAADQASYEATILNIINQNSCNYGTIEECLVNNCMWVQTNNFCLPSDQGQALAAQQGSRITVYSFASYQAATMIIADQNNMTFNQLIAEGINPLTQVVTLATNVYPTYITPVQSGSFIVLYAPIQTPCDNSAFYNVGTLCCPTPDCQTHTELIYGNPNHPKWALLNTLEQQCGVTDPTIFKTVNSTITISCIQLAYAASQTSTPTAFYECEPFVLPYIIGQTPLFPLSSVNPRINQAVVTTANGGSWHADLPNEETTMVPLQYFPNSTGAVDPSGQDGYFIANSQQFASWRGFQNVLPRICFMKNCWEIDPVTYYYANEINTPTRNISIIQFQEFTRGNNDIWPFCTNNSIGCVGFTMNSMTVYNVLDIINQTISGYINSRQSTNDNVIPGWGSRPPQGITTVDKSSGTSSSADTTSIREIQGAFAYFGSVFVAVEQIVNQNFVTSAYMNVTTTFANGTSFNQTIQAITVFVDDKYLGNIMPVGSRFVTLHTQGQNGNPGNIYGAKGPLLAQVGRPLTPVYVYSPFPGLDVESFFNSTFNFDPLQVLFVGDDFSTEIIGSSPTSPQYHCGSAIGTYTLPGGYSANTQELANAMSYLNLQGIGVNNSALPQFWTQLIASWPQNNITDFVTAVRNTWNSIGCATDLVNFLIGNSIFDFYRLVFQNSYVPPANSTISSGLPLPNGTISISQMISFMTPFQAGRALLNCGNCQLIRQLDGSYAPPNPSSGICDSSLSLLAPPVAPIQILIDEGQAVGLPFCQESSYYYVLYSPWTESPLNSSTIEYDLREQLGMVIAYFPVPDQLVISQVISSLCPVATNASTTFSISENVYLLTLVNVADVPITFRVIKRNSLVNINGNAPSNDPCNQDLFFTMSANQITQFSIPVCLGQFFIIVQNEDRSQNCTPIFQSSLDYSTYFQDNINRKITVTSLQQQLNLFNTLSSLQNQVVNGFNVQATNLNQLYVYVNQSNVDFTSQLNTQNQNLIDLGVATAFGFANTSSHLTNQAAMIGNISLSVIYVNDSVNSVDQRLNITTEALNQSNQILAATVNQTINNTATIASALGILDYLRANQSEILANITANLTTIAVNTAHITATTVSAQTVANVTSASAFPLTPAGIQQNNVNNSATVWLAVLTAVLAATVTSLFIYAVWSGVTIRKLQAQVEALSLLHDESTKGVVRATDVTNDKLKIHESKISGIENFLRTKNY